MKETASYQEVEALSSGLQGYQLLKSNHQTQLIQQLAYLLIRQSILLWH